MNILILGGNSPKHKTWIRQLGAYFEAAGHSVRLHEYRHWETGEPLANIDEELERLRTGTTDFSNYAVVAKSVGTVIAAIGTARDILHPTQCLFLGVPVDGIARQTPDFPLSLDALPDTVIVQNQFDPFGSSDAVEAYLRRRPLHTLQLLAIPNVATHDYCDFPLYMSLLHRE